MNREILLKLGQNIKKFRKLKKYTQETLAEKTSLHYTTIGKLETGKINASTLLLANICQILEIEIKDLFDFEN